MAEQLWHSPVGECSICRCQLKDEKMMVDGKTIYGPWALMCLSCHATVGKGLGTGKGQKYELLGKKWIKTAG